MRSPFVPARSYDPEILDGPDNSIDELRLAFADISWINRNLGGIRTLWRPLYNVLARTGLRRLTLLDVGTGGGEIPRAVIEKAACLGIDVRAVGLDLDPGVVRCARDRSPESATRRPEDSSDIDTPPKSDGASDRRSAAEPSQSRAQELGSLSLIRGDAFRLPFEDSSVDIVTSSMMAHHFREDATARLLAEMARVARRAVILNDLARHRVPWLAILALGFVLKSPMVRHDGPLSVLRGWTSSELLGVARAAGLGDRTRVERRFPYRLVVIVTCDTLGDGIHAPSRSKEFAWPGSVRAESGQD